MSHGCVLFYVGHNGSLSARHRQNPVLCSSSDLAFDVQGYAFILLNDAFTAASNVYTKKNLGTEVKPAYILLHNRRADGTKVTEQLAARHERTY